MSSATFRNHFDMISMHEPPQRKAKFWTSYVKALKGTEDIRANDDLGTARKKTRPMSAMPDIFPNFFDDVRTPFSEKATSRVNEPGYKYLPVSRDTYGSASTSFRHTPTPPARFVPRSRY